MVVTHMPPKVVFLNPVSGLLLLCECPREWGTCGTTNVTELQARTAQGERSREVLRDLMFRASAGD